MAQAGSSGVGQLALISALVIPIGASAGLVLEAGARSSAIADFGDALWWSSTLVTTVGSELYPVTAGGRVLDFALMPYAVGVFSYFTASIASVFVGLDAVASSEDEIGALPAILGRAERARR